ncbi:Uma2 family endonuclease [Streptomyces sp. NPDC086787]|uniref:Uma2 family endonuclease n=1 Tax=Streptomyces sp. NPDC086787 TaxID=3365759 RepID=UPI0038002EE0
MGSVSPPRGPGVPEWPCVSLLRARYPKQRLMSDIRIDYPGHLNGFATDVSLIAEGAELDGKGRFHHRDVEFIAEVISKDTAANDYGPKKTAYAIAEVSVHLVADPYQGRCFLYTHPKNGEYATETKIPFGDDMDLTDTTVGLVIKTAEFPRD